MSFVVCFTGLSRQRGTISRILCRRSTINDIRRFWWEVYGTFDFVPIDMTAWIEVPPMKKHGLTKGFVCLKNAIVWSILI